MSISENHVNDGLAGVVNADTQRLAAQMAQEAFTAAFRLSAEADAVNSAASLSAYEQRCHQWCQAGATPEAQALRRALLISGLDQWGLAYSQAFGLQAIPALSHLIGALRNRLDETADARFQLYFRRIDQVENDAIDFKVALRRGIHLALWAAMAACETAPAADAILRTLGGLMLAVDERMRENGWRLLADAVASIQLCLLNDPQATVNAQEGTQKLFEALRQALPAARYQQIMAHATQAVLAWQQAKRLQG